MEQGYHANRTINRTVLRRLPLGLFDWQSLPPRGWCESCRREIYEPNKRLCPRCHQSHGCIDDACQGGQTQLHPYEVYRFCL